MEKVDFLEEKALKNPKYGQKTAKNTPWTGHTVPWDQTVVSAVCDRPNLAGGAWGN